MDSDDRKDLDIVKRELRATMRALTLLQSTVNGILYRDHTRRQLAEHPTTGAAEPAPPDEDQGEVRVFPGEACCTFVVRVRPGCTRAVAER